MLEVVVAITAAVEKQRIVDPPQVLRPLLRIIVGRLALPNDLERPFLLRLAPEHLIVPVGVERRIDVNQINARIRQLLQLLQIVAAINDSGIEQRRRLSHGYEPAYQSGCLTSRF